MFEEQGQAESLYQKGMDLKKSGDVEAALTEFRRAVLSDPSHFSSQLEIGRLCLVKSRLEPFFIRHAFSAFGAAAKLNLEHQEAHDNYIMMAQKLKKLDDLLIEYDTWIKANPDNQLLQRCKKNILTISMALVPDAVNISNHGNASIRKFLLIGSIGMILVGIGFMFIPVLVKNPGTARRVVTMSSLMILIGAIGLGIRSRIK